jgi:uncharacterized phiE125 gp8 family phage protein
MNSWLTVISESETQDLTVLATVKTLFGITDNSQDAKLQILISQASGRIAKDCNRVFGLASLEETFYIRRPATELMLSRYPVQSISSITIDDEELELVDTEYRLDTESGLLTRIDDDVTTCWEVAKIVVAYTAGYTLISGMPQALEEACISMVRHLNASVARDPMAKRIEIPGVRTVDYWVGSVTAGGGLPPDVAAAIQPFRYVRLP